MLKQLMRKNNMFQVSNTTAIAYTLMGEAEAADKYLKMSVAMSVMQMSFKRQLIAALMRELRLKLYFLFTVKL